MSKEKHTPPIFARIQTRLIAAVGMSLFVTTLFSLLLLYHYADRDSLRESILTIRGLSMLVAESISEDLASDGIKNAVTTLEDFSELKQARNMVVSDTWNRDVLISPGDEAARALGSVPGTSCGACHIKRRSAALDFAVLSGLASKNDFVRVVAYVPSSRATLAKYGRREKGHLFLVADFSRMSQIKLLESIHLHTAVLLVGGFIALFLSISFIANRTVIRPIYQLIEGLGDSDPEAPKMITVTGGGEISELADVINKMRSDIEFRIHEIR
ncbi:MAG TPA: hypothetical protein PLQ76_00170, partial [bacterium]|nr:hypothetical protein [bacterium]